MAENSDELEVIEKIIAGIKKIGKQETESFRINAEIRRRTTKTQTQ